MSRDKHIEEMAKVLNECCNRYDEQGNHLGNRCYECEEWSSDNHCCCSYNRKEAAALYNAGYRNASDLEAEIADLNAIAEQYRKQFEEARTDVANEIFEELEKFMSPYRYPIIAELKKKYTEGEDEQM